MAQLVTTRTTGQAITNESVRIPRQVGAEIADLEPSEAPLLTFLMKMEKRMPVKSPRIEHYEQDFVARWTTLAEAIDDTETAYDVADGTLFVAGDLLIRPVAAGVSTVPDVDRVVSVAGNTITVVRGGTQQSASGDSIRIIGTAFEENANQPTPKVFAPTLKTNYTQIFRKSWAVSGTAMASEHYGAPSGERKREQAKKLVEYKQSMNGQFLFGAASESLTGGPNSLPIRTTAGLNSIISTNKYDANGVLTRKGIEEFARMSFRYTSNTNLLLASPMVVSGIHDWANSHQQLDSATTKFGVNITRVQTGHGVWVIVRDWMLENGAGASLNGFEGWAFSLQMEDIFYRYLEANGINRDTHLIEDKYDQGNNTGRDGIVDEYKGEIGLQIKQEKHHAKMYNAVDYSA